MATTPATTDETQSSRVQAVFDDIRRTRGSDFINAFWRHLALDAAPTDAVPSPDAAATVSLSCGAHPEHQIVRNLVTA